MVLDEVGGRESGEMQAKYREVKQCLLGQCNVWSLPFKEVDTYAALEDIDDKHLEK